MSPTPKIDRAKLQQQVDLLEQVLAHKRTHKLSLFKPYKRQKEFFDQGAKYRERLFMAGNRVGKSEAGAFEAAVHLTGQYPSWWAGKRFDRPVRGWGAGVKGMDVRNIMQKKLCGEPGITSAFGTGMIPKDCLGEKPTLMRGVSDAFDTIFVNHRTNGVEDGISTFHFKSYEQGRIGFQGDEIDFGWGDEESPKDDVYMEFLTRLADGGILYTTYTPMFGDTALTLRFMEPDKDTGFMHPDRGLVQASLDDPDITHFSEEEKEKRKEQYKGTYEYETRIHGTPMAGEGRVFKIGGDAIKEARVQHIPAHWYKLWGIDFGIGHPFAAVLILWDKDVDIIHVHHAFRMQSEGQMSLPLHHALAMKPLGGEVPVAWPQDGHARDKGSGEAIKDLYKKQGLRMLHEHSQWEDGGNSTEAGIKEMEERMATGRLKVADHLSDWFQEFNGYHRSKGLIVKVRDDLMSATRIAIMHKRFAKCVQLGPAATGKKVQKMADGVDFDIFNGSGREDFDIFTGENPYNDPFHQWR